MKGLIAVVSLLLAFPAIADDRQYPRHATEVLGTATEQVDNRIIPIFGPERGLRCGRTGKRCTVTFTDGRMSVDGSTGIGPDQIVSIAIDSSCCSDPVSYLSFRDNDGSQHLALFSATQASDIRHFVSTVMAFKSGKVNASAASPVENPEEATYPIPRRPMQGNY